MYLSVWHFSNYHLHLHCSQYELSYDDDDIGRQHRSYYFDAFVHANLLVNCTSVMAHLDN